jgi:DNA-binding Xre family transcriptional regulator
MALKLKEEFGMTPSTTNLMEDNMAMALESSIVALNIMKQVCDVLDGFLSFLMKYEKKNT